MVLVLRVREMAVIYSVIVTRHCAEGSLLNWEFSRTRRYLKVGVGVGARKYIYSMSVYLIKA